MDNNNKKVTTYDTGAISCCQVFPREVSESRLSRERGVEELSTIDEFFIPKAEEWIARRSVEAPSVR